MSGAVGNFFITAIIRSPLHYLPGDRSAVILVKGSKSGRRIAIPIDVARQGDGYDAVS